MNTIWSRMLCIAVLITFAGPLFAAGNSVRAQKTIADISNALGGNPYAYQPQ